MQIFFKLKNIKLKSDIVFDYEADIKFNNKSVKSIGLTLVDSNLDRDLYILNVKRLILFYTNFLNINDVKIIRQVDLNDIDNTSAHTMRRTLCVSPSPDSITLIRDTVISPTEIPPEIPAPSSDPVGHPTPRRPLRTRRVRNDLVGRPHAPHGINQPPGTPHRPSP